MIARRIIVTGRVQGVFFRDSTRRTAEAHGVSGWIRNRGDGAVEAHLEGEAGAVEAVIAWARTGPPQAHVEDVAVTKTAAEGHPRFTIR